MSDAGTPEWKSSFPVRQTDEHAVSRRQLCKAACGAALAVGGGWLLKDKIFPQLKATKPMLVARVDEVPIGGSKLFAYPSEHDPAILVRLGENEFAAFSQSCTHLMCPVNYQHEQRQFFCPCHEGFFSAEDGRVLAGPPPRALPRYPVEIRHGEVWIAPASA